MDTNKAYVDIGGTWKVLGVSKYDVEHGAGVFDGVATTINIDVSANITDARTGVIQLTQKVGTDYEIVNTTIKATSVSNVRIISNVPLPTGTYRLIVIE